MASSLNHSGSLVLTGISGNLGRAVVRALPADQHIIGIDRRPFYGCPANVEMVEVDLRKKRAEDAFRRHKISTVIHMGIMHDPRMSNEEHHSFNVVGTTRVLDCAARYGAKKVVVLSSASVYGPSPENSNFLTEDAPLMAAGRFPSVRDLTEVDMLAHGFFWKHPQIETVILRPVHIVGPTIKNAPSNYLRLKRPWMLAGFDPMVQLIHMSDAASAMAAAQKPGLRGVYNVVGPGEVPLTAVFRELNREPIPVPHFIARSILSRLFQLRLASFPPEELDHVQFLCAVDGSRWAKESQWKPLHSMRETIHAVDAD